MVNKIMSILKKCYLDHIELISGIIFLISIVFPILVLLIIRAINRYLPNFLGGIVYVDDGITVWLSFWGSYAGAIATIIIALLTLRLTLKNDISSKDSELNEFALKFHRFEVKKMKLYDLKECFPVKEIEYFDSCVNGRYLIKIEFCQPFPPYFDICLKNFEWGRMGESGILYKPMKFEAEYESNKRFVMLFLLNNDNDISSINELYFMNYFEPLVIPKEKRRHWIRIGLQCENKMYAAEHEKNENNVQFQIEVEFENISRYQEEYVALKPTKRNIGYCQIGV